jgi:hypothetical protein
MSKTGMYVCAEIGVNWLGRQSVLAEMVEELTARGIDAIKLQYFDEAVLASYSPEMQKALRPMILDTLDIIEFSELAHRSNKDHYTDLIVTPFSNKLMGDLVQLDKGIIDGIKIRHTDWQNKVMVMNAQLSGLPVYTSIPQKDGEIDPEIGKNPTMDRGEAFMAARGGKYYRIYCVPKYPPEDSDLQLHILSDRRYDGVSLHSTKWEDYFAAAVLNTGHQYNAGTKRRFYIEAHVYPETDIMEVPLDDAVSMSIENILKLQHACDRFEETVG